jgi:hypothetical protein
MSLKVPKNSQMQIFKDGYKVGRTRLVSRNDSLCATRTMSTSKLNERELTLSFHLNESQTMSGVEDAVIRNIEAVNELTQIVQTSFGPNGKPPGLIQGTVVVPPAQCRSAFTPLSGRNKLIINHLGKLFVTSDAATIIREIEVVHPAARLLVMASEAQESEVSERDKACVPSSCSTDD